MVLLEQKTMEQLGLNAQPDFSLQHSLENIKQELCQQTSALCDKENNLQKLKILPDSLKTAADKKKAGLYANNSSTPTTVTTPKGGTPVTKVRTGRRNARERNRVRYLNMTFEHLRQHLPQKINSKGKAKKMSKVDTLRSAIDYIRGLQDLLDDNDAVNAVFQSGGLTKALSDVDTLSPTHSGYSTDGSPCSLSPPGVGFGATTPVGGGGVSGGGVSASDYSMSTSADSALFSEEDGDDFIDITSWLQC